MNFRNKNLWIGVGAIVLMIITVVLIMNATGPKVLEKETSPKVLRDMWDVQ